MESQEMSWIMLLALSATCAALVWLYKRQAESYRQQAVYWYQLAREYDIALYDLENERKTLYDDIYEMTGIDLS